MKIKNRKIILHEIKVATDGRTFRTIQVTPAQLAKLNRVPIGKDFFLTFYYCQSGGNFWVIRTNNGLQYLPSPFRANPDDAHLLEGLLK